MLIKLTSRKFVDWDNRDRYAYHGKIIGKFYKVVDRERVRKLKDKLKHTDLFIHELFPKEIVEQRKRLIPHMLRARQDGKKAWLCCNKLYVNREIVTCYPSDSAVGIRITCPCDFYPLTPHFYIVKLGCTGVYIFFLFLL